MPPKAKKSAAKEVDPAELLKKKFIAKCLFRRLVRLAMANAYWLIEETHQYEGLDDVKKRVAQAMRQKKPKQKKLLSLEDKGLLNKPAQDRTDQEKKYIYRIIGGLKCFKRYPNHVKKKLAAVTYFKYYGPGRVIVRQHQTAHAMYFLLTGEVTVSQLVYDGLLNVYVPVEIGKLYAGDMFGEISLLHSIPRTATCTTIGHCELLALMKDDFKNILQTTVQASWDIVRTAMSFFSYFDGLDEVSRREGCIMAKIKKYAVDEIILGDNAGIANYVYFVLTGSCQMIETINVIENRRLGRYFYTLYDPHVSVKESEEDLNAKYCGNIGRDSTDTLPAATSSSTSQTFKVLDSIYQIGATSRNQSTSEAGSKLVSQMGYRSDAETVDIRDEQGPSGRFSRSIMKAIALPESKILQDTRESVRFSAVEVMPSQHIPPYIPPIPPPNIRTYFMQVCRYNPGSTFGFGENMRDRRIVALTPVECMLMPKIWLFQHNTANIWTRLRHYLDKKIPTKRQIFKALETERRWEEFREQLVNDVISRSNAVNSTSVHDVPYSIRLEEMLDL